MTDDHTADEHDAGLALDVSPGHLFAAFSGFTACAAITAYEHGGDGWWGTRLGRSRWRRANLPVGAAVVGTAAAAAGSSVLFAVAFGMLIAAPLWRYVDPLPAMDGREPSRGNRG